MTDYDTELAGYTTVLRRAWALRPDDRVLDIGCGAGETTREAAREAGSAVGVDVSATAIGRARALPNVTYVLADAQTHAFPPGSFDVAISRFGTMFFADPGAAFINIGRALRPGGRLVMLVWQAADRNEWDVALRRALTTPDTPGGPDPFSLADPATVERILRVAGFTDIDLADVAEPVCYGPDTTAALDWVSRFTCTQQALRQLDATAVAQTLDRLRAALTAHATATGIWFDSRAWLVTARVQPPIPLSERDTA